MLTAYEFMHPELFNLGPLMRLHLCVSEKWSKHFLFQQIHIKLVNGEWFAYEKYPEVWKLPNKNFSSPMEKSEEEWIHAFVYDNALKKEAAEYQEQFSSEDVQRKLTNAKCIFL